MVDEIQRRMVLLLNHVLMQEPEAQARLTRQASRVVEARWRSFTTKLVITPAGLMDLAAAEALPDLTLTVAQESPFELAQVMLRGEKPTVSIAGDVQLAAEINWLVEHVRWDLEEDLSRLVGDVPAHAMGQGARAMAQALRRFAAMVPTRAGQASSGRAGAGASTGSGPAASTGSGPA